MSQLELDDLVSGGRPPAPPPDEETPTPDVLIVPTSVADEEGAPTPRLGRPFDHRSPFLVGLLGGLGLAVAYGIARGVSSLGAIFAIIGLSLFLAIGLNPLVEFFEQHGRSRRAGVAVVAGGFVVLGGAFLWSAVPLVVHETQDLIANFPRYRHELLTGKGEAASIAKTLHLTGYLRSHRTLSIPTRSLLGAGRVLLSFVVASTSVAVLTVYFLAAMPRIRELWLSLFPRSRRVRLEYLTDEVFQHVGGFMLGNLLTSLVAGVGTYVWLVAFSIPYPLLLALFVAIVDLVPIVGSTVGGIVVSFVALTHGLPVAIATGAFYGVYRLMEDYLLNPHVMKHTVKMSAGLTIAATLIGASLLGLLGALVAIPAAATVKLVLDEVVAPRQQQR